MRERGNERRSDRGSERRVNVILKGEAACLELSHCLSAVAAGSGAIDAHIRDLRTGSGQGAGRERLESG